MSLRSERTTRERVEAWRRAHLGGAASGAAIVRECFAPKAPWVVEGRVVPLDLAILAVDGCLVVRLGSGVVYFDEDGRCSGWGAYGLDEGVSMDDHGDAYARLYDAMAGARPEPVFPEGTRERAAEDALYARDEARIGHDPGGSP